MAARFTEHQGDPAWLKAQREAQARAVKTHRQTKAMPYPTVTPTSSDRREFLIGARKDSQLGPFIVGAVIGAVLAGRRR